MAIYLRLSVKGSLPGGEVWSVNPVYKLATPSAVGPSEMSALLTAINSVPVPNELCSLMNGQTKVTGYRLEARETGNVLESVGEVVKTTPVPGTGAQNHPYQTSLVISLRTPSASASGKGRLYWPATGVLLASSTLRVSSTDQTNAVLGAKTYFVGLETAINSVAGVPDTAWSVWSTKLGTGAIINRILVGDVPDVQRRRRDRLVENYLVETRP